MMVSAIAKTSRTTRATCGSIASWRAPLLRKRIKIDPNRAHSIHPHHRRLIGDSVGTNQRGTLLVDDLAAIAFDKIKQAIGEVWC